MPGIVRHAHVRVMQRLQAEEALIAIEASLMPWVKQSYRQQRIELWQAMRQGTIGKEVDHAGRRILTTASQIGQWFALGGVASS